MTRLRVVVLLAVVALLLFPAGALADEPPQRPCRFHGTVQVDGADVPDGTTITATVDGDTYSTDTPYVLGGAKVYGASGYALKITPSGNTTYSAGAAVTFMIGGQAAEQVDRRDHSSAFPVQLGKTLQLRHASLAPEPHAAGRQLARGTPGDVDGVVREKRHASAHQIGQQIAPRTTRIVVDYDLIGQVVRGGGAGVGREGYRLFGGGTEDRGAG